MRLLMKLLLALLVLAFVLPFVPLMPGGMPLIALDQLKWPTPSTPPLPSLRPEQGITSPSSPNRQSFYKWRDAEGLMHYSDQPPPEGIQADRVAVDTNTNVLAPISPSLAPARTTQPQAESNSRASPNPYSPEQIKQLFEDAKRIQQQAVERNNQLNSL